MNALFPDELALRFEARRRRITENRTDPRFAHALPRAGMAVELTFPLPEHRIVTRRTHARCSLRVQAATVTHSGLSCTPGEPADVLEPATPNPTIALSPFRRGGCDRNARLRCAVGQTEAQTRTTRRAQTGRTLMSGFPMAVAIPGPARLRDPRPGPRHESWNTKPRKACLERARTGKRRGHRRIARLREASNSRRTPPTAQIIVTAINADAMPTSEPTPISRAQRRSSANPTSDKRSLRRRTQIQVTSNTKPNRRGSSHS